MAMTRAGRARGALRQQVEFFGESGVSLDSLWRSAGCPAGLDPGSWASTAAPLLSGYSGYLENLRETPIFPPAASTALWTWDAESREPWRAGDLMANAWVALLYAAFLDAHP